VIGHLVCSCQALGSELGIADWMSGEWVARFGTGSIPVADRSAYPAKGALLDALTDAVNRVSARLTALGTEGLAAPLPDERYRALFPTVGHAVIHILLAHTAVHVGQVSAWRRAAGYPALTVAFI
jgi:hypothetical protein